MEDAAVIRAGDITPIMEDGGNYMNYPVFAFDDRKLFETYRIVIKPGGCLKARPHLAGTEEYITLFCGQAVIEAAGQEWELAEGDSIRFKADTAHGYRNPGTGNAEMSMVIFYGRQ